MSRPAVTDETRVRRIRQAIERLKAMRAVYAKHGQRGDACNHSAYDRGAAHGLRVAIDELEQGLRNGETNAGCYGV